MIGTANVEQLRKKTNTLFDSYLALNISHTHSTPMLRGGEMCHAMFFCTAYVLISENVYVM